MVELLIVVAIIALSMASPPPCLTATRRGWKRKVRA
jgi:Tfp pilus assembly protein FimT